MTGKLFEYECKTCGKLERTEESSLCCGKIMAALEQAADEELGKSIPKMPGPKVGYLRVLRRVYKDTSPN